MQCRSVGRTSADEALAANEVPHSQAAESVCGEAVVEICKPHMTQTGCRHVHPHTRACMRQLKSEAHDP